MSKTSHDDALPVTVLPPDSAGSPATRRRGGAADGRAGRRPGPRGGLGPPGRVYLLLDLHEADGTWGCYVGKAAAPGVRNQMLQHVAKKAGPS